MLYGLAARQLDAFLVNTITNTDAFPLNFRCYFFSFAMKKGYGFFKFRGKMQNGDEFGKKQNIMNSIPSSACSLPAPNL